MMKQYKDKIGHCICYADAFTGLVEQKNGRVKSSTILPIGGEFRVERDDVVTILKRVDTIEFQITSYKIAA